MHEVTQILAAIDAGDSQAAQQLMPLVYDELRRLAAVRMAEERPEHTLQATALVHEAYLRLIGSDQKWENRGHFFAAAANSMRQILVDWARRKHAIKRGEHARREPLEEQALAYSADPALILDLDEAVTDLASEDAQAAEIVKLRLFAGLSMTEIGETLGLSRSAVFENWQFARAWFAGRKPGLNAE
ncbi:RNA polymerase sigma factor SigD [Caulifigura coniformis]|uniref:RNA polymerase sigma factor SigD n=1 Tax=Caulifigura coniformis TaxID=2527983 RepID=A0A517SLL9_9PLAN|nr:ECF-type sigma factor [Caulifigura coniformis]QDT57014.1 RNA polymerase sigma factor SigD [Caulifigura coniformis]